MSNLYRLTRGCFVLAGVILIGYGCWVLAQLLYGGTLISWLGIFPVYVGAMLILVAAAMREDWFTNARKYW